MYFTNKKFTIEKEKLSIFNSLFSQYDEAKLGRISPKDARLILRELGIESLDAQKIVAKADPEKRSLIKYEIFVETLRIHLVRQAGGGVYCLPVSNLATTLEGLETSLSAIPSCRDYNI